MPADEKKPVILIRRVWAQNVVSEFELIKSLLPRFHYVSMDTEFPGCVFQSPSVRERNHPQVRYQVLKLNVDALKLIQLGLTLCDADGNLPHLGTNCRYAWEFNFSDFDVSRSLHAPSAISMLKENGIDFERSRREGISSLHFADLMFSSGLVGNGGVHWVSFHGSYDFGYLVKILTQSSLPELLTDFMELLTSLFGSSLFDVKYMGSKKNLYGGLERLAKLLQVERAAGNAHQAGSDSLLTCQTFLKMSRKFGLEANNFAGIVYGLNEKYWAY
ncbi:probable CCR4-associated factor 1 homolog 11 [Aristolochia californica]|uniref:probable CCR4-associated factor 1 homolog 11 n=1 Tax=Aristolochia californica TaxID=171875 RepID=UPI0035DBC58D